MSINRTRWVDKLRPAGALIRRMERWHLLRTLMQLLLTSAVPSNIGRSGDTIIQTQLCVALRMGEANLLSITNCHLFASAMLSSRSIFPGNSICACHPTTCFFKKYPSQILNVILVQEPCSNIQSRTIFVREPCNSVQKKKLRHPCAGAMRQCPAEGKASSWSRSSYLRTSI